MYNPQQLHPQDSLNNNADALPPIPFIKTEEVLPPDTAPPKNEKKVAVKPPKTIVAKDSTKSTDSKEALVQKVDTNIAASSPPVKFFDFTTGTGNPQKPYELVSANKNAQLEDYRHSLFTGHELQVKELAIEKRERKNNDWFLALLLGALFIIAFVKVFQPKRLKQYLNSIRNENIAGKISREETVFSDLSAVLLFLSSLIILSLFIFQMVNFYGFRFIDFSQPPPLLFIKTLLLLLIIIVINLITLKIAGFVFKTGKIASDYAYTTVLFINILSLLLLPIVIAIEYLPLISAHKLVLAGGIIALLIFAYKAYRGLVLGTSEKVISKFYLFLYLCTLELLPLVVLFKAFISKV